MMIIITTLFQCVVSKVTKYIFLSKRRGIRTPHNAGCVCLSAKTELSPLLI